MTKIEKEITSDIERFKQTVSESNGTGEICRKYEFSDNGKSRNLVKFFIEKLQLPINHFGANNHPRKYVSIEKECPNCKQKFLTLAEHPREKKTCSSKCANKLFAKPLSLEQKEKIKNGLKQFYQSSAGLDFIRKKYIKEISIKNCKYCKSQFKPKSNKIEYCSKLCQHSCLEYREKLRQSQLKKVSEGTHSGWKSRKIGSYPEQFFMGVLINNNIQYEHNKPVGRYFIDFAIESKKIALEIDGKQHQYEDRKKSDVLKDKFLEEQGWKIYRIQWKSINNESGKLYIKNEIAKFLEIFNGDVAQLEGGVTLRR